MTYIMANAYIKPPIVGVFHGIKGCYNRGGIIMRLKGITLLFVMIIIFLVLSSCSKPGKERNDVVESKQMEELTQVEETGLSVGEKAYDFTVLDREGNPIKLSDLEGKVVMIHFWTTWSGTCNYEMPHIQEIYENYKEKNAVVLAANVLIAEKINMEGVNQFLDEKGYTVPVMYDIDGAVTAQYGVTSFPTTYIIDKDGNIADLVVGSIKKEEIEDKIDVILGI